MNLAPFIEHTNLSAAATGTDIDLLVDEAKRFGFFGVCVPPFWVRRAQREIGNNPVKLITVAGFPLGYSMTETKMDEIVRAIDNGADEVDMVWNLSSFKAGIPWTKIDIAKCCTVAHARDKIIKVIIETSFLSDEEILAACTMCADAGSDFVKTSTGFGGAGAKRNHIELMRAALPADVRIKASGGIKTYDQALQLKEAGADRIGTSSGINILESIPHHHE